MKTFEQIIQDACEFAKVRDWFVPAEHLKRLANEYRDMGYHEPKAAQDLAWALQCAYDAGRRSARNDPNA